MPQEHFIFVLMQADSECLRGNIRVSSISDVSETLLTWHGTGSQDKISVRYCIDPCLVLRNSVGNRSSPYYTLSCLEFHSFQRCLVGLHKDETVLVSLCVTFWGTYYFLFNRIYNIQFLLTVNHKTKREKERQKERGS